MIWYDMIWYDMICRLLRPLGNGRDLNLSPFFAKIALSDVRRGLFPINLKFNWSSILGLWSRKGQTDGQRDEWSAPFRIMAPKSSSDDLSSASCMGPEPPRLSACVSRSLSTPAADAYDQLHAVTSSSQPQKQSATALVASPSQDQLRGTRCWHHSAMTNCLSLHFAVYSRLNFSPQHTTLL